MAARAYTLAVTAVAKPLSQAIPTDPSRGGPRDEAMRQILLSMDTAVAFIGDSSVTTTVYGVEIWIAAAGVFLPVSIGPFDAGPVKLSDLYVIGTSGTLHILAIPF